VRPENGGISHLISFVPAALVLHLAVVLLAVSLCRKDAAEERHNTDLAMEFVAPTEAQTEQHRFKTQQDDRRTHSEERPETGPAVNAPRPAPHLVQSTRKPEMGTTPLPHQATMVPATASVNSSAARKDDAAGPQPAAEKQGSSRDGTPVTGMTGRSGQGSFTGSGTPSTDKGTITAQRYNAYAALLKRLIESHKEYPLASRRTRQEGSCQRRFTLWRGGRLKQVEALSSCGHPFLDEAATRAITSVGAFPPLPEGLAEGESRFTVTITFTLTRP
jgi:TonB family protein